MSITLTGEPVPDASKVQPFVVDGAVAIYHWAKDCYRWIAFSMEELTPNPQELACPNCGETSPIGRPAALWEFLDDPRERLTAL